VVQRSHDAKVGYVDPALARSTKHEETQEEDPPCVPHAPRQQILWLPVDPWFLAIHQCFRTSAYQPIDD
jgi:hypothetical protein